MAKLIVLFVTAFVDTVGLAMVLPIIPYHAAALGASATVVGALVAAFSLAQLACAPIWGRFSDRYGRRPVILVGLILTAGGYLLFGMAGSVLVLFLSRIVQGAGGGTVGVVQAYVADASAPELRTKRLGSLTAVTSLGAVVGPAVGSALIATGGRSAPGYVAAGIATLVAGFAWAFLKEAEPHGVTTEHPIPRAPATPLSPISIVARWREPASRLVWTYAIAIGAFYAAVFTMPLLLAQRLEITEHTVGFAIMYLGGMGVIVRTLILGTMVDRFGEDRLSQIGLGLLALGLLLLGGATNFLILILALTVLPLSTAFIFPCLKGQLSRLVSRRRRGLYLSVQHTCGSASQVVFALGIGLGTDQWGVGAPFFIAGGLVLTALMLSTSAAADRASHPHPVTPSPVMGLPPTNSLAGI